MPPARSATNNRESLPLPQEEIARMLGAEQLAERLESSHMSDWQPYAGWTKARPNLAAMWWPTELLIADSQPDPYYDTRFEASYQQAVEIAEHGDSLRDQIRAKMFLANAHLLALRGHKSEIGADDIKHSYYMMAQVVADSIEQHDIAEPVAYDLVSQAITYALIARKADVMNIPFVASVREQQSPMAEYNHDMYTLGEDMACKTVVRVDSQGNRKLTEAVRQQRYVHDTRLFYNLKGSNIELFKKMKAQYPERPDERHVAELIIAEAYEDYAPGSPEDQALSHIGDRLIKGLKKQRAKMLGLSANASQAIKNMSTAGQRVANEAHASGLVRQEAAPNNGAQPQPDVEPEIAPVPRTSRVIRPPKPLVMPPVRDRSLEPRQYYLKYYGEEMVNPYLQAEHIPPRVLDLMECRGHEAPIASLWKTVEQGLALFDPNIVTRATLEAQEVIENPKLQTKIRVGAAMLRANSAQFARRAGKLETTREDIWGSFCAMAGVMEGAANHDFGQIDKGEYSGLRAELVSYCLVAYAGNRNFIPYIGSMREEHARLAIANHDLYTLPDRANATKLAAQVKNSYNAKNQQQLGTPEKPRHTFLLPIYATEVLQDQAQAMGMTLPNKLTGIRMARRLILKAARETITPQEEVYLEGFSRRIIDLFVEHRGYIAKRTKFHKMPYTSATTSYEFVTGLKL